MKVGDKVWLEGKNLSVIESWKLLPRQYGPFTIKQQIGQVAYKLELLHADFAYRADRLIPCVQLTYAVTSTSPWHGLSALELLIRSQLRLRVYSVIESPKYFKAKLTRYCS